MSRRALSPAAPTRTAIKVLRAGVAVLTDAELDDELAAAQQDADEELVELLAGPIPTA